METLLAKALESKLKYYLRSYTRDQFRLQGRTVQLSNLDLNGDVLHAIIGLPSTLRVSQARVGKLEIKLPPLASVKTEPTVVAISKLDLVIAETRRDEPPVTQTNNAAAKSTSYGFADKIADGMTIEVGVVNLMLETRGGSNVSGHDTADWIPPIANITIRNMLLYTTNENWEVVNLSDTRQFFKGKKTIYIFRKLEWESLSIDILPHPDMFKDVDTEVGRNAQDDGAKRAFFGGERFVDNISGNAFITMHRTETNNPLGLQVDLKLSEALCPKLSEPALRALMRFMAGVYVCLNRPDMKPMPQLASEAAGRSFLDVSVDTIFLRIKETEYQMELVLQSLRYIKGSVSEGDAVSAMSRLYLGNVFLRDTFSHPPTTLIQPRAPDAEPKTESIPAFASDLLWPRIYPLPVEEDHSAGAMLRLFSAHIKPAPEPPTLAGQLVIRCNPLKITLQEESCFRIASLLADTRTIEHTSVTVADTSLKYQLLTLDEFDLTVPVPSKAFTDETSDEAQFTGARLLVTGFSVLQDPFLRFKALQVERDAACFPLWEGQPVNASQLRFAVSADHISVALETGTFEDPMDYSEDGGSLLWRCVDIASPRVEIAMFNLEDKPLVKVPPPGGIVRLGLACKEYASNTSRVQLLFVLQMYTYMGKVSKALVKVSKGKEQVDPAKGLESAVAKKPPSSVALSDLASNAPGDSAVSINIDALYFRLLESIPGAPGVEGAILAQFLGGGIALKVTHRSLGGAAAITSTVTWQDVSVECVETEDLGSISSFSAPRTPQGVVGLVAGAPEEEEGIERPYTPRPQPKLRAIFWKGDKQGSMAGTGGTSEVKKKLPFIDINVVNVIPYDANDGSHTLRVSAKIGGVRLGGGMGYNEALMLRFGVLEADGTPGKEVLRFVSLIRENGVLASLLGTDEMKAATKSHGEAEASKTQGNDGEGSWDVTVPDEMDLDLQLLDWLFALEGAEGVQPEVGALQREERCWHSTFRMLRVAAASGPESSSAQKSTNRSPIQAVTMRMEGVQALKPRIKDEPSPSPRTPANGSPTPRGSFRDAASSPAGGAGVGSKTGLDLELRFVSQTSESGPPLEEEGAEGEKSPDEWAVKSVVMAVQEPVEVEVTKEDMDHLVNLCKSEVAAVSRIAAAALKLLQMQGNVVITQATIDQLINLGARAVTGEDFVKHEDGSVWKNRVSELEAEVSKAQGLCKDLVKDLMKAWVRDPGGESELERRLSMEPAAKVENVGVDGEVNGIVQEGGEEETEVESVELVAARRVADLTAQLERLQDMLAKVTTDR